MKTVSKYLLSILVITAISFAGCRETKKEKEQQDDHGHSHEQEEVKQEEFTVGKDSLESKENTHTHDKGGEHHDH